MEIEPCWIDKEIVWPDPEQGKYYLVWREDLKEVDLCSYEWMRDKQHLFKYWRCLPAPPASEEG